jgi:hypothetical protein
MCIYIYIYIYIDIHIYIYIYIYIYLNPRKNYLSDDGEKPLSSKSVLYIESIEILMNIINKSKIKLDSSILIWIRFLKSLSVCLFLPGYYLRQLYVRFEEVGLMYGNVRVVENVLGITNARNVQGNEYILIRICFYVYVCMYICMHMNICL